MHVRETNNRRESGETGDLAVGGDVESHNVRNRRRRKDPRLVEKSALLDTSPKDVKGTRSENFKAKEVSHTPNKTEQTRGGQ